ncbi:MAG: type II toxin-antitoxin system VapC family toxin [Acidimicrobiales bacterium]
MDTTALAKLVRPENETRALGRWLAAKRWIISDLHRTELRRAAWRAGGRALARAERLLSECDVTRIDARTFDRAGRVEPSTLRTFDALHLAAAMTLGADLSGLVVYDERLRRAASDAGIRTASPGA